MIGREKTAEHATLFFENSECQHTTRTDVGKKAFSQKYCQKLKFLSKFHKCSQFSADVIVWSFWWSPQNFVKYGFKKISRNSATFWEILRHKSAKISNTNFNEKIKIRERWLDSIPKQCKGVHGVDPGESFPTSIYLQNLASIQPRTSSPKFDEASCRDTHPDHKSGSGPGMRCHCRRQA